MNRNLFFALLLVTTNAFAQTTNPSPYCLPEFSSPGNPYLIDTLIFDGTTELSNSSTKFNNSDYVYYNNLANLTVSAGVGHLLRVEGYAPGNANVTIWVDYNHDNMFESNEQLQALGGFGNVFIENMPFTIPSTAGNGITRMRIALTSGQLYGEYPCPTGVVSDTTPVNGEYADYQINITGGASIQSPTINTVAALNITGTGATLNGIANANGDSTTLVFEYGLTTSYGSTVTPSPAKAGGSSSIAVLAPVTGLQPNTMYHFRLDGTNGGGTTSGADMSFTTDPTGVQKINNGSFVLYPNPAKGIAQILIPENFNGIPLQIELLDMKGSIVMKKNLNANNQFNISALKSGIYELKIFANGQQISTIEMEVW